MKGEWHNAYFKNKNPITLELGCGKGEYTLGLAEMFPQGNFIGLDIKGARMWKGCKMVEEKNLTNVAFIRTRIELLDFFFTRDEVDEIWLTFPDPRPRRSERKKRLISPEFLSRYSKIMKEGGLVHLKTDNDDLFEYGLEVVRETGQEHTYDTRDLYNSGFTGPAAAIKTYYEGIFLEEGKKIKYLQFRFRHV